jgi:hypothetical protein
VNCPVIDADGHVLEKERYIPKYLEVPGTNARRRRGRAINHGMNLFDSFETAGST